MDTVETMEQQKSANSFDSVYRVHLDSHRFFLRGLSSLSIIPPGLSTHAFTAGAIGIMIYAMITRVALGHSGRPIRASKPIVLGYICITLSAIVRVFGPWPLPQHTLRFMEFPD
ncbi:MAG: NnrS family protein [Bdellovibrionota bacterium]